jgi:hypothetical protein
VLYITVSRFLKILVGEVKSNGTVGTQFLRQKQSVFLNIANANLDVCIPF